MERTVGEGPDGFGPLQDRVADLRARVEAALRAAERGPGEVSIIPASKGMPPELLDALHASGFEVFGESRIGEFVRKLELRPDYLWDFFGRFRIEDAPLLARTTRLVHSVATLEQAEALDHGFRVSGRKGGALLQVNVTGEPRKQGWTEAGASEAASGWRFQHLLLRGLMVIGPRDGGPEQPESAFRSGRQLFDRIRGSAADGFDVLSMGMSDDFEAAIRAGSTLVRIGTLLSGRSARADP
jgi:pyridoxal phosphate enzyme (YggS family)